MPSRSRKNIPSLNAEDQTALIANQFTDFEVTWAPGFSVPDSSGYRCEFGNLTLVKQPLFRNSRTHILSSPVVDELQIPRTMAEVIIDSGDFEFAIFNTHLAFHSSDELIAQINDLTRLRDQAITKAGKAKTSQEPGPYIYSNAVQGVLLCGDLNIDSESDAFKNHIINQNWFDCWDTQKNTSISEQHTRQPTCGCFDRVQWQQGPHVRDYFLATKAIANSVLNVFVNVETAASDHQPVLLEIDL